MLAFEGHLGGSSNDIFVVPAGGGEPRRVTRSGKSQAIIPGWSRDGKWIYFASESSGGDFQIWKVPAATLESEGARAIQVTHGGGMYPIESRDGKYLYFAKGRGKMGVWRKDLTNGLDGREEQVIRHCTKLLSHPTRRYPGHRAVHVTRAGAGLAGG